MNLKAVAAAAALLAAGAPAFASAQTTAPVSITGSQVQAENVGASRFEPGAVSLSYVNHRDVPATEVNFTLSSHGQNLGTYTDYGTFSKGVAIDRYFTTDEAAADQQIDIASVKFADGTTWTNDEAVPQRLRQAAYILRR